MAVSFFVNRLYVLTTDGKVAYDEPFHHGVNIIRGANSSGNPPLPTSYSMVWVENIPSLSPRRAIAPE